MRVIDLIAELQKMPPLHPVLVSQLQPGDFEAEVVLVEEGYGDVTLYLKPEEYSELAHYRRIAGT